MDKNMHFVIKFKNVDKEDAYYLGERATVIADLYNQNYNVPNGFIISKNAFHHFLKENKLEIKIKHILSTANFGNLSSLHQISLIVKKLILDGNFPNDLLDEILSSYKKIHEPLVSLKYSEKTNNLTVTHFTSKPGAILNIKGDAVLIEKIKQFWASFFDSKEIFYRHTYKLDQINIETSLIIQEIIESEQSGVIYTTMPNNKSKMIIKSVLGLGELIKEQEDYGDIYEINKADLSIVKKYIYEQKFKINKSNTEDKKIPLSKSIGNVQKISDEQIIELAKLAKQIENLYFFPQKIDWSILNNKIYIIQLNQMEHAQNISRATADNDVLIKGISATRGIASGPVRLISSQKDIEKIQPQEIVVLKQIKSTYLPAFKRASAIILESYDNNIQILFTSNELKLPCITDAKNATSILKNEEIITVNATKGEIYRGGFAINSSRHPLNSSKKLVTDIYINLQENDLVHKTTNDDFSGFLLQNSENIIRNIGIHPHQLIIENRQNLLIDAIYTYLNEALKFSNKKTVIYKISNLTSADYRKMEGGINFEQTEENPNLGFRGSFRHIHDKKSFYLELESIKNIINNYPENQLWLIIPYVRSVEELIEIKDIISEFGLQRSQKLKFMLSIDIPSNIIFLENFIKAGIDGIFINSDQLSSLLTGTDITNSEIIAEVSKYNAYLKMNIEKIIKITSNNHLPTFLFNNNLSNSENLLSEMIKLGLNGVCINSDSLERTKKILIETEKKFINNIDGKN